MDGDAGVKPPQTALAEKPHEYVENDCTDYGASVEGMFAAGARLQRSGSGVARLNFGVRQ